MSGLPDVVGLKVPSELPCSATRVETDGGSDNVARALCCSLPLFGRFQLGFRTARTEDVDWRIEKRLNNTLRQWQIEWFVCVCSGVICHLAAEQGKQRHLTNFPDLCLFVCLLVVLVLCCQVASDLR